MPRKVRTILHIQLIDFIANVGIVHSIDTPTVKAQSQSSTQPYVLLSLLALLAIIAFAKGA